MALDFSAPLSGISAAITQKAVSANDVANVNTPGFTPSSTISAETKPAGVTIAAIRKEDSYEGSVSLADEATEQMLSRSQVSAEIRVVKTQDEMNQTVIDLRA